MTTPEQAPPNDAEVPTLGHRISDAWSGERCCWHVDYDSGAGESWPWIVILEWTQEYGNLHDASWTTYTWQFYGETLDVALTGAAEWCEALLPWRACPECDGQGIWNGVPCVPCGATGLESSGVVRGQPLVRASDTGSPQEISAGVRMKARQRVLVWPHGARVAALSWAWAPDPNPFPRFRIWRWRP